ncbi:MAG TPA: phosphoglycerate kinase [Candidatus Vogelbacteria bacterium]|nr:phosphoglycerate kinase [Candidatus Vogelbacteria bacterium]
MKKLKSIKDFPTSFWQGKKVIVRVDFNLPLKENGRVSDWQRLIASLPTIKYLKKNKAKILLISHAGNDKSLKAVGKKLNDYFKVGWLTDIPETWPGGEVNLLENIRYFKGEESNSVFLAKRLAKIADFYINEAFSASHRKHTSIVGLPKLLPGAIGLLFALEMEKLTKLHKPQKPFLLVLGGAKLDTKLPLLKTFLPKVSQVYLAGIPANSIYKKLGWPVGKSVAPDIGKGFRDFLKSSKVVLPVDFKILSSRRGQKNIKAEEIMPGDMIVDMGKESLEDLFSATNQARTILWNGPLGYMEKGFKDGTRDFYKKLQTKKRAEIIIAGGDTIAGLGENSKKGNIYLSSGGGATLAFLTAQTLPGIEALKGEFK